MIKNLTAPTREDLLQSIEYAVKFNSAGKATNAAWDYAATARAGRVLEYLEQCGYVIMNGPPLNGHSTP